MLEFSKQYPKITLRLEEGDQEQLIRDLAQGRIEAAVTYEFGIPAGFDSKPLLPLPPVAVLPADHRLAQASDVSLTELEKEPYILFDGPHAREYLMALFDCLGLQPNIALRLRSFELIRGLVARGHGYTINMMVPLTSTTYDGGHVVVKPLRDRVPPVQMVFVTPGSHLVRPAVGIFAEFLVSSLRRGGYPNEVEPASSAA
jgi:DNA-binding transcriptional LysR family regulator